MKKDLNELPVDRFLALAEDLEQLVTIDWTERGVVRALAAASRAGTSPLGAAALALRERTATPGARVLIITGWPSRSWLMDDLTETDGPVGAAVLARVLEEASGAISVVAIAAPLVRVAVECCTAAGLIVTDLDRALRSKPGPPSAAACAVLPLRTGTGSERSALDVLRQIDPAAVIAVEAPGPNRNGLHYNVSGRQIPADLLTAAPALFRAADERGALTIGIGDGGNELGMGRLEDAVRRHVPHGEQAACAVPAAHTLVACISNWGAYALAAAVCALAGRPDTLERIDVARVIARCVDAGGIDGLTARPDPLVDGTPAHHNTALMDLIRLRVSFALGGWNKR